MQHFKTLKDPYLLSYVGLYLISLVSLALFEDYPLGETIGIAITFGVLLPTVAYWSSRSSSPISPLRESSQIQLLALGLCTMAVVVFLSVGPNFVAELLGVTNESVRMRELLQLLAKLTFLVFIPMLIFARMFGFSVSDFGLELSPRKWADKKQFRVAIILIPLMLLFQLFVGQGVEPIRSGSFSPWQLLVGLPLAFLWLLVEVGLVEEFFFRALLQNRLSASLKSESAGILITALLFGLAHAPGLYLRGAGANSPVGTDPSALFVIGYSIVVLSAAGLFMGIVWSRTRNLLLIMAIHASVDALPNLSDFIRTWGIGE